jgi:enoyl-CoA hydratase/carnithine racemase
MASELQTEHIGPVLVLTLTDPATRNTLSPALLATGLDTLRQARADHDVRAVVLRGAAGHFCAGGNLLGLLERRAKGPQAQLEMLERLHGFVEALRSFPKPVIAAVEGAAAGAGFSLALACDQIIAAEDARFILSYSRIGLSPDGGATWSLMQAVPRARVQQMLWLAEPVSARQLFDWGLVSAVTPNGQAFDAALRLAERLGAMASNALASAKELLQQASGRSLNEQLAAERDHLIATLFHDNAEEGLNAFLEKRPPTFR